MRKIFLLILILSCFKAYSQDVIITAPTIIQGRLEQPRFTLAANSWSTPDMTIPANSISGQLVLVDDGTTADSLGCGSIVNNVSGKIAVIYRGSCGFGLKALNAQNAGAIGVIIINNQPGTLNMTGGTEGLSVNIPVVAIIREMGVKIRPYIDNGTAFAFLGTYPTNTANNLRVINHAKTGTYVPTMVDTIFYPMTPVSQIQNFILGGRVKNNGLANQSNITLTSNINSGLFTNTTSFNLNSGDSISRYGSTLFTPPATTATYNLNISANSSLIDNSPLDNFIDYNFQITDTTYAVEDGIITTIGRYATNAGDHLGNLYPIYNTMQASSVTFYIPPGTPAGTDFIFELMSVDGAFNFSGMDLTVYTTNGLDGDNFITVPFGSNLILNPGLYYLGVMDDGFSNYGLCRKKGVGISSVILSGGTLLSGMLDVVPLRLNLGCPEPSANLGTSNSALCNGVCDGVVTINYNASFPYTVNVYDDQSNLIGNYGPFTSTANINNLCAGSYTFEITYTIGNGCPDHIQTINHPISNQSSFSVGTMIITPSSNCGANDGSIQFGFSSTGSAYTNTNISWSGPVSGNTNVSGTFGSTSTGNNLLPGNYTYTYTSLSNPSCLGTTQSVSLGFIPAEQELCVVSTDSATGTYNVIVWEKGSNFDHIDSFYIYREITLNNYGLIAVKHADSLSLYEDFAANPNVTNYKYKIVPKDSCGNFGDTSLYHNSIHLQYFGSGNFQWTLYEIESMANQVASYNFYRDDTGSGPFNLLSIIPGGNNSFTDVNYLSFPLARYRVDVNWLSSNTCTPSRAGVNTSRSNIKNQSQAPTEITEEILNDFKIYPNPVKNIINLYCPIDLNYLIKCTNALGEVILIKENQKQIDLSFLPSGIYFLQIETMYGSKQFKLIKE